MRGSWAFDGFSFQTSRARGIEVRVRRGGVAAACGGPMRHRGRRPTARPAANRQLRPIPGLHYPRRRAQFRRRPSPVAPRPASVASPRRREPAPLAAAAAATRVISAGEVGHSDISVNPHSRKTNSTCVGIQSPGRWFVVLIFTSPLGYPTSWIALEQSWLLRSV